MVKGVSKTVIVVNNTGSKLFEKIVFYVTPEYGTLSAKQLKKAASSFSFNYKGARFGVCCFACAYYSSFDNNIVNILLKMQEVP